MKGGREGRRDRIYLFHLKGRTASILPLMHPSWVHEFYVFRCKGISIHSPRFSFENHWVAGNPIFQVNPKFRVLPSISGNPGHFRYSTMTVLDSGWQQNICDFFCNPKFSDLKRCWKILNIWLITKKYPGIPGNTG